MTGEPEGPPIVFNVGIAMILLGAVLGLLLVGSTWGARAFVGGLAILLVCLGYFLCWSATNR